MQQHFKMNCCKYLVEDVHVTLLRGPQVGKDFTDKPLRTMIEKKTLRESSLAYAAHVNDIVSVTLHSDSYPHCLEIAPLQKGLVLSLDGMDLIEEGVGFGVPVAKYGDRTYFSGSAECFLDIEGNRQRLVKRFHLDTISRKRIGTAFINDDLYSFAHGLFENAYLAHKNLASVFNIIMELRRTMRVKTEFVKVKPKGTVTFEYSFHQGAIEIKVSLNEHEWTDCRELLLLNEQGSSFFRKYNDTSGVTLFDKNIGAWQRVNAEEACFTYPKGHLAFSLSSTNSCELFRGWEKTRGRFSWAGLGYCLKPSLLDFKYEIKLSMSQSKE